MSFSTTRIPAKVATVLGTALALACPGTGIAADSGGAGYDEQSAAALETRHALLGKPLNFRGTAQPGQRIAIQRLDAGTWVTEATAAADREGRYLARWRSQHIGVFQLRAVPAGSGDVRASAVDDEPVRVTVYKPATATWYGRGWYGRKTACGQTLSPTLMGVAHKTLPCGTRVSFLYRGRSITVPVIDRGPYGAGISWDLTTAAADALDFLATGKGTVGAVSLRRK
jgi:rare lipoprotein A